MWSNFTQSLVWQGKDDAFEEGLKAFVWMYYHDYTDATEIEPAVIAQIRSLIEVLQFSSHVDYEELIREAEKDINDNGGVQSGTGGGWHKVCTFTEDADA